MDTGGSPNCPAIVDASSAMCHLTWYLSHSMESIQSIAAVAVPAIIGLSLGLWLGKTQARQQRSYATIIRNWFTSIVSMSKFWIKFHMVATTNEDGTKKARNDVYVTSANGNGTKEIVKNYIDTSVEAGCDVKYVPKHVAVIMDGNRRYGKRIYGQGNMGHFDGGQKLLQVIEWLDTEGVKALTIYAFSTENWNRESTEVDVLMGLFQQFVETDLRPIVFNRKVQVKLICTDVSNMPPKLHAAISALEDESFQNGNADSMTLNVCLSYGSRGEIVKACQSIAQDCMAGKLQPEALTEDSISERLLTAHSPDPDVLIRTSGEERISNFLLWQLSYTELFFLEKDWPELDKEDFLKVIRTFAKGRERRFGK